MKLTPEQYEEIEKLSGIGYPPDKIAIVVGIPREEIPLFVHECGDFDSEIYYHYTKGALITEANIKKNLVDSAKTSITAGQIFEKSKYFENLRKHKNSLENTEPVDDTSLAVVKKEYKDSLDYYYALQSFIDGNGEVDQLPEELMQYWLRLNTTYDLFNNFYNRAKGKKYIVKLLRMKYPGLSESSAYRYISEAVNFFCLNISKDNWRDVQHAALDKVISTAWQMDRLDLVIKAIREQNFIRGFHKDDPEPIPEDLLKQKVFIITNNPADFGFPKVSRKELLNRIKNYDISETEKSKILKDAGITDVDYEELANEEPEE